MILNKVILRFNIKPISYSTTSTPKPKISSSGFSFWKMLIQVLRKRFFAYNTYIGKHNVGKGIGSVGGGMTLPSTNSVNNFGILPSSWFKKAPVPLVYDGVIGSYIETLHKIVPGVTDIKIVSEGNITVYTTVSFDQKAISPGICEYQKVGFGVFPSISHQNAISRMENGYPLMLKDVIKDFKEKNRAWVKNGEVFFIQITDCFVAVPIAVYYLSEAGKWNDV